MVRFHSQVNDSVDRMRPSAVQEVEKLVGEGNVSYKQVAQSFIADYLHVYQRIQSYVIAGQALQMEFADYLRTWQSRFKRDALGIAYYVPSSIFKKRGPSYVDEQIKAIRLETFTRASALSIETARINLYRGALERKVELEGDGFRNVAESLAELQMAVGYAQKANQLGRVLSSTDRAEFKRLLDELETRARRGGYDQKKYSFSNDMQVRFLLQLDARVTGVYKRSEDLTCIGRIEDLRRRFSALK